MDPATSAKAGVLMRSLSLAEAAGTMELAAAQLSSVGVDVKSFPLPSRGVKVSVPVAKHTFRRRDLWKLLTGKLRFELFLSGDWHNATWTVERGSDGRLDVEVTFDVPPRQQWVTFDFTMVPGPNVHLGED